MANYLWRINQFNQRRQVQQLMMAIFGFLLIGLSEFVGLWQPVRFGGELLFNLVLKVAVGVEEIIETPIKVATTSYKAARRIQDLELRYSEALAQVSELQSLKEEHEALRQLIENTDRSSESVVVTAPIVSQALPAVAAGSTAGVEAGDLVLAGRGLVGIIDRVSPRFSTVQLLTGEGSLRVVATTDSGVTGVLRGDGKRIIMDELPIDAQITVGQKVLTTGQVGVRRDIFVGTIAKVTYEPSAPVQQAVIDQVVDFGRARIVEVVK